MTIIKKFEPEQQKERFPKKYIIVVSFSLFVLVVIEIWANNTSAAYGDKLDSLSRISKSLEMENKILENDIAKSSSLISIASKSAKLGFFKSQSIQYIH